MNHKKIENVLKLSASDRYDYFIRKVTDFEEVWGLKHVDGWALLGSGDKEFFPVWPEKDFAQVCAVGSWTDYLPELIPLSDFLEKLIPKLEKDQIDFGIFLTPEQKGIVLKPDIVLKDILEENEQYE